MLADPRKAAGHDAPMPLRIARGKDAEQEGAGLETIRADCRQSREADQFLPDIINAALAHIIDQRRARRRIEVAADHRAAGQAARLGRERRADQHRVESADHPLAFPILPAPPGCDVRHAQILARQPHRQARHEGGERRRLEHARARRIGDHDIARAHGVDQPRHANPRP